MTSILLAQVLLLSSLANAADPVRKHRRGLGLIPKKPAPKGPLLPSLPMTAAPMPKSPPPDSFPAPLVDTKRPLFKPTYQPLDKGKPLPPLDRSCAGMDLKAIFEIQEVRQPELAPQGVYFVRTSPQGSQIYLQTSASAPPTLIPTLEDVSAFRSSPDKTKLAVLGKTKNSRPLALWKTSEGPLVPIESEAVVSSVAWADDSSWIAFTSNRRSPTDFDLYRYELASGQTTLLASLSGYHEVRDISPDGKTLALIHAASKHSGSWVLVHSGKPKQQFEIQVDPTEASAAFTPDGQSLFFSALAKTGTSQVHLGNLASGAFKPLGTQDGPVEHFRLNASRLKLVAVINSGGPSKFGTWTLNEKGSVLKMTSHPEMSQSVVLDPAAVVTDSNSSDTAFYFARSTPNAPSALWYWDGKTEMPWSPPPALLGTAACEAKARILEFPSKAGIGIRAIQYSRASIGSEAPTVVYLHDGPDAQHRPRFSAEITYLLSRGYKVLALNLPGSTGYGRLFEQSDNGPQRPNSIRDLIELPELLKSDKESAYSHLFAYAKGAGAWPIAKALEARPDLFTGAAAMQPILSPRAWLSAQPVYLERLYRAEWAGTPDVTATSKRLLVLSEAPLDGGLTSLRKALEFFENRHLASEK